MRDLYRFCGKPSRVWRESSDSGLFGILLSAEKARATTARRMYNSPAGSYSNLYMHGLSHLLSSQSKQPLQDTSTPRTKVGTTDPVFSYLQQLAKHCSRSRHEFADESWVNPAFQGCTNKKIPSYLCEMLAR